MSINIPKSSCYGCQSRHAGCHAECETGKEYTAALRERNQEIKAERDEETKFNAYKADRVFDTKKNVPNINMRQQKARA
jgi:hypothetical protein